MKFLNLAAVTTLMLSGTGYAADTTANAPISKPSDAASEMDRVGSPAEASGKITSIRNCILVGVTEPHIVIKLQSEDGDIDIVDLGAATELKKNGIEPKEGQQLWVEGKVGRINDKPLVFAEHISESKLITVTRVSPLREETTKHADARNENKVNKDTVVANSATGSKPRLETVDAGMLVRTVEGTVMETRKVNIEGETAEHMMVKIQTDDGVVVLDLGAVATLPKVDLTEGQSIAATGFVGRLNDRPVIVADSVGNLSRIQKTNVTTTSPVIIK